MPLFISRAIHMAYLLVLTGCFWEAVSLAWHRYERRRPAGVFLLAAVLFLIVLWWVVYPSSRIYWLRLVGLRAF